MWDFHDVGTTMELGTLDLCWSIRRTLRSCLATRESPVSLAREPGIREASCRDEHAGRLLIVEFSLIGKVTNNARSLVLLRACIFMANNIYKYMITLNGGSLGSWVDEERSMTYCKLQDT